jgi:tetratricopeptide (TPR) repeat protein
VSWFHYSLMATVLFLGVSDVFAQNARISRPSQQTGSAVLGRIGGNRTKSRGPAQSLRSTPTAAGNSASSTASFVPGLPQSSGSGYYLRPLPLGSFRYPRIPRASISGIGRAQIARAKAISGLSIATNPQAHPYVIANLNRLPALTTPVYVRDVGGTAFHSAFGLTPSRDESVSSTPFPDDVRSVDLMQASLFKREQALIEGALSAFTAATDDRPISERLPDLKTAESRLKLAIALKSDLNAAQLYLCQLHIYMELEQIGLAARLIDDALKAEPRLFVDRISIARRMGDYDAEIGESDMLDRHYRRYVVTADYNPDSVDAQILTGYCGVNLGDWRRVDQSVAEIEERLNTVEKRERLDRFLWAMKPALAEHQP